MSPRHPAALLIETLEPRILYSADLMPVASPGGTPLSGEQQLLDQTQPTSAQTELLFVDARISNYQTLVDDFMAQAGAGRQIEVIVIGADEDGVAKIGESLSSRQDVAAIHLLSHGESGAISLGTSRLDSDTLLARAPEIAAWGSALQADGDILVYGCEVAEGSAGKLFIDQLAALTGADVAASKNLTGSSAQGGDWNLEYRVGTLEYNVAASPWAAPDWQGVLATYTVTNTNDSGAGSLRQAITDANATTTVDDTIAFNISGTGVHTITLASGLPTITDTVIIDATTDDSFAANGNAPAIVLNGNGLNVNGLRLSATADSSTIRGLVIRNFGDTAIRIDAGSDGNTIAGNYLGAVDATGNQGASVNASYTLFVAGANNVIGGSTAADRNVLGTNGASLLFGVLVTGATATGNQILGNYIGIGAAGSTAFSGIQPGISVLSGAATTRIEGNVIAADGDHGVYLNTTGAGTVVHNNLIGTNAAGTAMVSTPINGLWAVSAGANTVITNNVIAGASESGIRADDTAGGLTIQGNRIGTDAAGTANWGVQWWGMVIRGSNNLIGGTSAGQGNIVANSNQAATQYDGIAVPFATAVGNAILGNSIYGTLAGSNGLGIDLGAPGVTANDLGDGDTSANNLQNFPVLTTAVSNGTNTITISGSLNSTASSYYRIEFFASPTAHASGYGEGQIYLGFTNVATDGSGNATFSTPLSATVPAGYAISATATKSNLTYSSFTDTSEFALSIAATVVAPGVLVVDTASDTNDGDTSSITNLLANKGADGFISLREAITATNNTANGATPDEISFAIAGTGTHTITLGSALPNITEGVVINASTDDSFAANGNRPAVILNAGGFNYGLSLNNADNSTVRGLAIRNFGIAGISLNATTSGTTIAGNYIGRVGTDGNYAATGSTGTYGILLSGNNNVIGGSIAADANVIGVGNYNIFVSGAAATGNQISGNHVGVNASGSAVLTGSGEGIALWSSSSGTTIANNVIATDQSGRSGINDASSGSNVIQGNYIGTDAAGSATWGTNQYGIWITSSGNLIGGSGAGQGNVVAYSNRDAGSFDGIYVDSGTGNAILGNSVRATIAGTGGLGIDLGTSGTTANDAGDGDTGANNLQNFPVLSTAVANSGQITITGTLNSTASTPFRIEFFASPSSSNGQGQVYLGFVNVTTNASNTAAISATLSATVQAGYVVTATATRSNAGFSAFTDTSEFSAPVTVTVSEVVVTTAADNNDAGITAGNGTHTLSWLATNQGADGLISLREAIIAANNTANVGGVADTINFGIAGTGTHTITLASALPTITDAVILDASTDNSFAANGNKPAIVLNGNNLNSSGLTLSSTADGSTIRGLLITNFQQNGIAIQAGSDGNTIAGNYIGQLTTSGTLGASTVGLNGIYIQGANNTIGGSTATDRNLIAGTTDDAIEINGEASDGNIIQGNWIGLAADGTTVLSTSQYGIYIQNGADNTLIGGSTLGQGNVIVGTDNLAISLDGLSSGTLIRGNYLGTDSTLSVSGGNYDGINLAGGAHDNMIGGTGATDGNYLANSTWNGIYLWANTGTGNAFLGNHLWNNAKIGIDLVGGTENAAGITANDTGDADTGANNLQNFPVLTLAKTDGSSQVSVSGTLNSTASSYFRIEFFASPSADSSGHGEGQIYLGFVNVATNGSGNATFSTTLSASVPVGYVISATATKSNVTYSTFTDTSEFARNIVAISSTQGVLVVDTASDTSDGDTTSLSTLLANKGADGFVSLREAITAANNTANGSLADLISFGIAGTGTHTITTTSVLPTITDAVVIDATTDDSFAANSSRPAIVIDGNDLTGNGLRLGSSADGSTIRGLVIRNFDGNGIQIDAGSDSHLIVGNYIGSFDSSGQLAAGTGMTGTQATGNGIYSEGDNVIIGGSTAADRNLFGGNASDGIDVRDAPGTQILGNWIGVSGDGGSSMTNAVNGVYVLNSSGVEIGGTSASDGNWITGGTGNAVQVEDTSNALVQNNRMGTDLTGTLNWGNTASTVSFNGTGSGSKVLDNIIAFGGRRGVALEPGITATTISANSIYGNTELGIDLSINGVTANDTGDADAGANNLQNFPALTLAKTDGSSQVSVSGTLNSTASSYFRIEFFASPSADSSGYGEGQIYLGFVNVATNGSGNATFSTTLSASVPVGYVISATATKSNVTYSTFTDTSEFARNIVAISSTQGVLVVDTASDTSDGDTTSLSTLLANKGADGLVSLREAITAANNTANGSLADLINFGIAGTGTHTITLGSSLPTITGAVIINATTDDSFAANGNAPAIVLDSIGQSSTDVLRLSATADGSTVRGLAIWSYGNTGIQIDASSDGNTIAGNYIGMVGTDGNYKAGTWNGSYAIYVGGANNVVGGNTAADRNVIGNGNYNVFVGGVSGTGNQIIGNYVGVNASGTAALTGSSTGITQLGGAGGTTIANNVIASVSAGIYISNANASADTITGNLIGLRPDGSATLGNATQGIYLQNSDNHVITGNWIGGGSRGMYFTTGSDGNTIQGNRIGTDLAGTANWGATLDGLYIDGSNNRIGGAGASEGNIIAFSNKSGSTYDGITINSGTGNTILGNSIYGTLLGTSGLGIDFGASGATANDTGDGDAGSNNLQNFPVLTLAKTDGSNQITVAGTLNSSASSYFRIELFANPSVDSSAYGEGQIYLGYVNVVTDGSGNASFSTTITAAVPVGYAISATATKSDATYTTFTDTSEFARDIIAISSTQATIIVDTAADTLDGDTTSLSTLLANKGADGFVSLREAITAANNTANGSAADLINFGIAGTGAHTITLGSILPTINEAVVINAASDDSFAANGSKPAILLNGNNLAGDGLTLSSTADGSTIRGFVIRNFNGDGIQIDSGSDGNTIAGNFIGNLSTTGSSGGVGNTGAGIFILGANNTIGGTTAADRNVISGNDNGIVIDGASASGNQVVGNYIGTDYTGNTAIANNFDGVRIQNGATANTIGGSNTNQRNIISGNGQEGVEIDDEASDGNIVKGNWIGVGADGSTVLGTGGDGIFISGGADNSVLGGAGANEGNWIASPDLVGIEIDGETTGTVIQGNRIGTDLAGTANWGGQMDGILIENSGAGGAPSSNLIADNVVAFSGQGGTWTRGIVLYNTAGGGNTLLRNSIYSNVGLGIDLGATGVTGNDGGDGDTGPNNLQNFPILTAATTNGSTMVNVSGTLNSNASSYFRIEFFASATADTTTFGEGQIYLGYVNVATNGSGNATFGTTLSAAVPVGYVITATATKSDASYSTFTDTSEFSMRFTTTAIAPGVLVVDTASDTNDGDTTSITSLLANKGADGFISLREAIAATNNTANVGGVADTINFNILGIGVHTITLGSALPTINEAVVINATTDSSFGVNGNKPAIVLDGNNLAGDGLTLSNTADGSSIRGLVIQHFNGDGIQINSGSNGNTIAGNYIGKLTTGGTTGTTGNAAAGINVFGSNNTIGGVLAADRNVISGNTSDGVTINGGTGNQVIGNYIGTDASGNTANGNLQTGVFLFNGATGNSVLSNVIAANTDDGIAVYGETSDGNTIRGNWIGLGANGTTVLGMGTDGIYIDGGSDNNLIGGSNPGEGNTVVGADWAIWINGLSSGNVVRGNYVGTDSSLTVAGANNDGIVLDGGAFDNMVGGTSTNDRNYVTNSASYGIDLKVTAGTGNALLGNQIWNNTALGIDIGNIGVQANDLGDADTGANNLQNFPVLTLAKTDGSSQVTVAGTLNSTAGSYFRIELFANSAADPLGHGEGQIYLGFVNVATDGSGNASFSTTLAANVPVGYSISATATKADATYSIFTDTSEFARDIVAISATQATIVVDTAADTLDGDTTSLSTLLANKGADGFVSLREAITAANNTANGSQADRISFGIVGTSVHTINLASALPSITDAVILDASTDDSFAANGNKPAIVLQGNGSGTGLDLLAGSGGSTIRGFLVQGFATGIRVEPNSDGNSIAGNWVGQLLADGSIGGILTNTWGIAINSANNVIGGTTAADRNVVTGNTNGNIRLQTSTATGNLVIGNYVGTNANGLGTSTGTSGISVFDGAHDNQIGGPASNQANLVAGLSGNGILLAANSGSGNAILGNSVYDNGLLGIDLGSDDVTANDTGDADTGANNLQNFPVLTLAKTDGSSQVTLAGTLNSTAGSYFRIEFYASPTADSSGHGEGQIYLGFVNVATDGSGNASFSTTLTASVPAGYAISATATKSDASYTSFSDTSEFAASLTAGGAPVNTVPGAQSVNEDTVLWISGISVADQGTFTLTVGLSALNGSLNVNLAGGATINAGANGTAALSLTGSLAQVNAALATLTYQGNANYNGGDTLSVVSTDPSTLTANSSVSITVLAVNDAPTITNGASVALTGTDENTTSTPLLISNLLTSATWADADTGALKGVAITAAAGNGTWQYSTNGVTWTAFGSVSASSALLLTDNSQIRYIPDGSNGETATFAFKAWDQTTGSGSLNGAPSYANPGAGGGSTAYSSQDASASLTVSAVNDAPIITSNGGGATASISLAENVSAVTTVTATDADLPAQTLTYSISGADAGRFAIDANTGVLTFSPAPDYDNPADSDTNNIYEVTVTVSDGGLSDSQNISITITPHNDNAPVITSNGGGATANINVPENNLAVTTVTATDADLPAQTLTYSIIGGTDAGHFNIDSSTGALSFLVAPDFEAPTDSGGNNVYDLIVQVSDGSLTGSQTITVTVTNTNDNGAGAISDTNPAANSLAENAANGTTVGITAFAVDPDVGDTINYSLDNDAGGRFVIDANTGIVTVANSGLLNYEAATSHNILVRATSSDSSFTTANFTISLTDINEFPVSPVSDTNVATNSVAENAANGTVVGVTAFASDADGTNNTVTYSLSNDAGGRFAIDANTGIVTVANGTLLDYEAGTSHGITVLASSSDGSTSSQGFTISLTDVNEFAISAVTDTDVTANNVAENAANGSTVGITAFASDADGTNNTVTYSLDNDAGGRFAIDANSGIVTVANSSLLDYEAATSHNILVRATSSDTSFTTANFTVSLTDVNEFAISAVTDTDATANSIAENAANGSTVGITAFASDADGSNNTVTYSLSNDAGGRFAIDANTGIVTVANGTLLDYEAGTSHGITVLASSSDGSPSSQAFTISLTDVNEFAISAVTDTDVTANSIAENAANGTVVGVTAFASDADGSNNTVTYSLSNDAGGRFAIDANTGVVTVANGSLLDYEAATSHGITVLASSSDGSTSSQAFTISLTDVNEFAISAVTDTDATANTVAENATSGTVVGVTAFASDTDGTNNTVTYSLSNDAGGRFAIDANTGIVTVANGTLLDYEAGTSHGITVLASSSDGSSSSQAFTISLTDVNEFAISAVTDTDATANTVAENAANGSNVGITAFASDADGSNNTVIYSLSNDAGGRFAIDANTGIVTVANGTLLDYEAATSHGITVLASSSDGSTSSQGFTISLTDVNEFAISAVTDTDATANSVAENAANGSTVGITAFASDADGTNNTIIYSLSNDAGGRFAIDANTGVVTVANGSLLDYEAATSHAITVLASSSDGSTSSQAFTISLTDVNEFAISAVTDTDATANSIAENAANGSTVGVTAFASDADGSNNTVTYSLSNDAGGRFAIDANTGIVTVANGTLLDYEVATSHGITVLATSADGSASSQAFTISLSPLNDNTPAITSDGGGATASLNIAENTTTVTTVTASDADLPAQTLGYSIIGGADAALFTINSSTGALSFITAPDFEAPTDSGGNNVYDVVVQASDGALTGSQAIAVSVFNSNEAPTNSPLTLSAIAEDSGPRLITQLELLANAADVDGPTLAAIGLTITAGNGNLVDNGNGTWTYTPALNDDSSVSFAYTVTDGNLSAAGSATLGITPLNDAPTISAGTTTTLPGTDQLTTSGSTSVASLLSSGAWADVDSGALKGVAILGSSGMGTWQYSTDGSTWTAFGNVSGGNALLLADTSLIRYIPDGVNGEIASFSYQAWDQTAGSASSNGTPRYATPGAGGGSSAYSTQQAGTSLTVTLSGTIPPITPPTIPIVPLPPVIPVSPPPPTTGTTQPSPQQPPSPPLPTIGDLFFTPGQPSGAGHFELAGITTGQDQQQASSSVDFYSTRRWNASYPALQFKLQSIAQQSIAGYSLNAITQLDIAGTFTADRLRGEASGIPAMLDEGLDKLISPAGVVAATGVVFSAGMIWWAARAGGLMASLALSLPTWRNIDPLSVVGRKKDDPEDWGVDDDKDLERLRDERAVTGMLEDMTEQRL